MLTKIEVEYTVGPNFTGNIKIQVKSVRVNGKEVKSYNPVMVPDPTLFVWDIVGTDNEALTLQLQGV